MTRKKLLPLMKLTVFMLLMMVLLSGCFNRDESLLQNDPFFKLYEELSYIEDIAPVAGVSEDTVKITLSALEMPLSVFCRVLSDKFKIGIVYSEGLTNKTISAEFKNTDLKSLLNIISRQLSIDVVKVGNTYYIGQLRPEDRGIYTGRLFSYDRVVLKPLIDSLLSSQGKSEVLPNGAIIVNDHESVLRRVGEAIDYINSISINTWIVQLYFVAIRKDLLVKGGLAVKTSGSISYDLNENKVDIKDFVIDGLFNVQGEGGLSDVFASPMLLTRDGAAGKWKKGERVPIPKYSTSDYGTVTVTGYDYVDTGFLLTASVNESKKGGLLQLDISMSNVSKYIENAPQIDNTSLTIQADMESKKLYLLGELTEFRQIYNLSDILMFGKDTGKVSIQVWGQIYKISGDVLTEIPKSAGTKSKNVFEL